MTCGRNGISMHTQYQINNLRLYTFLNTLVPLLLKLYNSTHASGEMMQFRKLQRKKQTLTICVPKYDSVLFIGCAIGF